MNIKAVLTSLSLLLFFTACGGGGGGGSSSSSAPPSATNTLALVVIAISFDNTPIKETPLNCYNKIFSANPGNVNDYYSEVSQGDFALSPANETQGTSNDGIINISLSATHPGSDIGDLQPHLTAALAKADTFINFALFDKNSNGNIEVDELQIMFIVGGGEASYGDISTHSIWAHTSTLSPVQSFDGVSLNGTYSSFGEEHGYASPTEHFATIGIIVHELGHAIWDLPDLYDRDNSSYGIGDFGIMATGAWGKKENEYSGTTPSHFSAYCKIELNWVNPTLINASVNNIAMKASHHAQQNIIKIQTNDPQEYFLVENRSPLGYDAGLYTLDGIPFQGGLAIWHIDEGQILLQNNDETHKLVDLEEAANPQMDAYIGAGTRTNLYYAGNRTLFNNTTTPNSRKYNGSGTGIAIGNISPVGDSSDDYIMYLDIQI